MTELIPARTPHQLAEIRRLFREYETFLGIDLDFQNFAAELAALPGPYAPPQGALLLGLVDGKPAGCGALRRLDKTTCEMKRLFVRKEFRGRSLGRDLARELIGEARHRGYAAMLLDTLDSLGAAMRLYASLGFRETDAYYPNPLPGVVYWRLEL